MMIETSRLILREMNMGDYNALYAVLADSDIMKHYPYSFDEKRVRGWNDDWSNQEQLHAYIMDLIGNKNSLVLGLFEDNVMVGLAMGNIKHWYTGTEYYIEELCIKREEQGRGLGTQFLKAIEGYIKSKGITHIFLQTERTVPAYSFYKKKGFVELTEHVSFIKEC